MTWRNSRAVAAPRLALNATGRPERVLIVDDDTQISRLVGELIRTRAPDVSLEIANDGFEAGAKVESFRPHALVLDLMMPGMDGFEVCKRLRARPTLEPHSHRRDDRRAHCRERLTNPGSRRGRLPGQAFRSSRKCCTALGLAEPACNSKGVLP